MRLRSFIAIHCPAEVKEALVQAQKELKQVLEGRPQGSSGGRGGKGAVLDVGWTRPEGIHLTLKFLGEVEESEVPRLAEVLRLAASPVASFPVTVEGVGVFPGLHAPRVLWVGIRSEASLSELQRRIEQGLEGLGFGHESRPFRPHLTLGRFRPRGGPRGFLAARPALEKWLAENEKRSCGRFQVRQVFLMKSDLKPGGAVYTSLAEAALGVG